MEDCEAIERATLAGVPPQAQEERAGWLLAFDDGTVGRARSAAPLRHAADVAVRGESIVLRYRERGHPAMLRLPDLAAFESLQARLARAGFGPAKPTLVQSAALASAPGAPGLQVELRETPDAAWAAVFVGEGFDPVDGASRVAILRRGQATLFASAMDEGRVVAVGAACFAHGWCGIHGMRTLPSHRGRGYAGAIVTALMRAAAAQGAAHAFLQVEEGNAAARSLYASLGFTTRWRYRYWQ